MPVVKSRGGRRRVGPHRACYSSGVYTGGQAWRSEARRARYSSAAAAAPGAAGGGGGGAAAGAGGGGGGVQVLAGWLGAVSLSAAFDVGVVTGSRHWGTAGVTAGAGDG